MDPSSSIIIAGSLLFSAFFSGTEIAYLSSNKLSIELESKQGDLRSRALSFFLKRPSKFIGAMLLGNNIALVVYGIFMAQLLEPWIYSWLPDTAGVLIVQTILSTILILVVAEFLPKAVFQANPNGTLRFFAFPLFLVYWILWIPVMLIIGLSEGLLKLITGTSYGNEVLDFGRTDLDRYVQESSETSDDDEDVDHEVQIFRNALDFSRLKARECMIPRTEVVALEVDTPMEELKQLFIDTGLSKILIFRDNIDNIIGYAHSYEMFRSPDKITSILRPVSIVPESMPSHELLEFLIKQRKGIAVVVDEYGGTSGIITIEDVIEEIFGEIDDEHDVEELHEKQLPDGSYEFSGRYEIDQLNETYKLELPESDEYETLAGLIMHRTGEIPDAGSTIDIDQYEFTILERSGNRIDKLKVAPREEDV